MKRAEAKSFGLPTEVLSVEDAERPILEKTAKKGTTKMVVRVQTASIAPADLIVLSGTMDKILHPGAFPFCPGAEICGVVEEVQDQETKFKVGDTVVASAGSERTGGLAQYAVVNTAKAAKKPDGINSVDAVAFSLTSLLAAKLVKAGDRVLVLGGSGGVGSSLVQMVRTFGAEFVACTSTNEPLMKSVGVDKVIDYKTQNWWEISEFEERPFDIVYDCVECQNGWDRARSSKVIKNNRQGGRWIAIAMFDPPPQVHSYTALIGVIVPTIGRWLYTSLVDWSVPKWVPFADEGGNGAALDEVLKLVEEGKLKHVVDPASPFEFTTEGVEKAFTLLQSKRARGKCVIKISE